MLYIIFYILDIVYKTLYIRYYMAYIIYHILDIISIIYILFNRSAHSAGPNRMGMDFCWISERFFSKMSPKWLQNAPPGLKIHLGAFKIDLWCYFCFKKCNPPMWITHFYPFWIDLGLPFGSYFGGKIVKKSVVFSMLFFSSFWDHFWLILGCFGKLLGGQKSLRSHSRRDLLKSEQNFKKCHRVASKSRFAGAEVDAKMSLRGMFRHEKNTCSAS